MDGIFDDNFENFGFLYKVTNNPDYWFIIIPFNIKSRGTCPLLVKLASKLSLARPSSGSRYTLLLELVHRTSITIRGKWWWLLPTLNKGFGFTSLEFTNTINIYHDNDIKHQIIHHLQHSTLENIWLWDLENSAKLRTYRLIKQFSTDNYVLMDLPNNIRTTAMQFRDTPLCVKTGNFCGVLLDDKICTFCIFWKKLKLKNTF